MLTLVASSLNVAQAVRVFSSHRQQPRQQANTQQQGSNAATTAPATSTSSDNYQQTPPANASSKSAQPTSSSVAAASASASSFSHRQPRFVFDLLMGSSCQSKSAILRVNKKPFFSPSASEGAHSTQCGEDAYFMTHAPNYSVFGVADGVGGWNALGVNPAEFAWALLEECKSSAEAQPSPMPWDILAEAYDHVKNKGKVTAGSSTACVVSVDKTRGILHAANLGDSGFILFRLTPGAPHSMSQQDQTPSKRSKKARIVRSSPSQGQFDVVFRSQDRQHYFNAPFQLSIIPTTIPEAQRRFFMADDPSDAVRSSFDDLLPGDIVVMGTDGLFDNMYIEEIAEILESELCDLFEEEAAWAQSTMQTAASYRSDISADSQMEDDLTSVSTASLNEHVQHLDANGDPILPKKTKSTAMFDDEASLSDASTRTLNSDSTVSAMTELMQQSIASSPSFNYGFALPPVSASREHIFRERFQARVQHVAERIVREAAALAVSPRTSPFGKEARLHGWEDHWGGKVDDITVVTALVIAKEDDEPMALL